MRPPLLKQQLFEPTNFVQRLLSHDAILSSWDLGGIEKREKAVKILNFFP